VGGDVVRASTRALVVKRRYNAGFNTALQIMLVLNGRNKFLMMSTALSLVSAWPRVSKVSAYTTENGRPAQR
jgi:hypothetical protein